MSWISIHTPFSGFAQCSVVINSFPYQEDFELSDGNWVSGGTANDWAWGTPSKPVITGAGSGLKCWIAGGAINSFYLSGERSFVQSPCFDFTNLQNPSVSFKIFWETEKQYDGANFQYSVNGGTTWSNVGSLSDPVDCRNSNWFNYTSITNLASLASIKEGWSGNIQPTSGSCQGGLGSNGWLAAKHTMPYLGGEPQVIFRFTFGSGTSCNAYDGFAFDALHIEEALPLPVLTYQTTQVSCNQPDGTAEITVTGGTAPFAYTWSPNVSAGFQATGLSSGTYTVTVSETGGCTVSTQFLVPKSPDITLNMYTNPDTCDGGKGWISAAPGNGTPPFQFLWNTGATTSVLSFVHHGAYIVTVTDQAGCSVSQDKILTDTGYFSIDLGDDFTICGAAQIVLNPGPFDQYLWQDGSSLATFSANGPGIYKVVVTKSGCTAADSLLITENCLQDILVPGAFTPNDDGRNEILFGVGRDITSFNLSIFNRWGILVFQSDDALTGWDGLFKGNPASEGIYVWKLVFNIASGDSQQKTGTVLLLR